MELIVRMSERVNVPSDFGTSMDGLIIFRACGTSLQYVTESFVKIRNLALPGFFKAYPEIPWKHVFGMRNFLSHDYGEVDEEGIFNTVKDSIPTLLAISRKMKSDLDSGKLDIWLES
ncbi:MAG: DUF86 domain-containing protein [Bacteroidales bacterium]|nr:DUF86 domain-containing protein [Bacteroidales bacterium]